MSSEDLADSSMKKDVSVGTDEISENSLGQKQYFRREGQILMENENELLIKLNWNGCEFMGCLLRENENNPWAPTGKKPNNLQANYKQLIRKRIKPKKPKIPTFKEKYPTCFVDNTNVIPSRFRYGRDHRIRINTSTILNQSQNNPSSTKRRRRKSLSKESNMDGDVHDAAKGGCSMILEQKQNESSLESKEPGKKPLHKALNMNSNVLEHQRTNSSLEPKQRSKKPHRKKPNTEGTKDLEKPEKISLRLKLRPSRTQFCRDHDSEVEFLCSGDTKDMKQTKNNSPGPKRRRKKMMFRKELNMDSDSHDTKHLEKRENESPGPKRRHKKMMFRKELNMDSDSHDTKHLEKRENESSGPKRRRKELNMDSDSHDTKHLEKRENESPGSKRLGTTSFFKGLSMNSDSHDTKLLKKRENESPGPKPLGKTSFFKGLRMNSDNNDAKHLEKRENKSPEPKRLNEKSFSKELNMDSDSGDIKYLEKRKNDLPKQHGKRKRLRKKFNSDNKKEDLIFYDAAEW